MKYDDLDTEVLIEIKSHLNMRLIALQRSRGKWNSLDGEFLFIDYGDSMSDRELDEINSKIRQINAILFDRK